MSYNLPEEFDDRDMLGWLAIRWKTSQDEDGNLISQPYTVELSFATGDAFLYEDGVVGDLGRVLQWILVTNPSGVKDFFLHGLLESIVAFPKPTAQALIDENEAQAYFDIVAMIEHGVPIAVKPFVGVVETPVEERLHAKESDPDKPEWRDDMVDGPKAPYWEPKKVFHEDSHTIYVEKEEDDLSKGKKIAHQSGYQFNPQSHRWERVMEYESDKIDTRGHKKPWLMTFDEIDSLYPVAKEIVDGRSIRFVVPNRSSIGASLENYTVLDGIREVSMTEFDLTGKSYSTTENERISELANAISKSNEISPIITVVDAEGSYILEGGHRAEALHRLKAKSVPSLIVLDEDSLYQAAKKAVHEGKFVPPIVLADYPDLRDLKKGKKIAHQPGYRLDPQSHRWERVAGWDAPTVGKIKVGDYLMHALNYYNKLDTHETDIRLKHVREVGIKVDGVEHDEITRSYDEYLKRPPAIYAYPYDEWIDRYGNLIDVNALAHCVFIKVTPELAKSAVVDDIDEINMAYEMNRLEVRQTWPEGTQHIKKWKDINKIPLGRFNPTKVDFEEPEVLIFNDIAPDHLVFGQDLLNKAYEKTKAIPDEDDYIFSMRLKEEALQVLEQEIQKESSVKLLVLRSRPKAVTDLKKGQDHMFEGGAFQPHISRHLRMMNRPDLLNGPPEAWRPEGRGFVKEGEACSVCDVSNAVTSDSGALIKGAWKRTDTGYDYVQLIAMFNWTPLVQNGSTKEYLIFNSGMEEMDGLYLFYLDLPNMFWRVVREEEPLDEVDDGLLALEPIRRPNE